MNDWSGSCACAVNLEPSPEASQRSKEAEIEQAILENVLTTLRDKIKELDQDKWVIWHGVTLHAILCRCSSPARQLCVQSLLKRQFSHVLCAAAGCLRLRGTPGASAGSAPWPYVGSSMPA